MNLPPQEAAWRFAHDHHMTPKAHEQADNGRPLLPPPSPTALIFTQAAENAA